VSDAGRIACKLPGADALPRRTVYLVLLLLCVAPYRGILDNWLFNDDFSWLKAARFDMAPGNILTFQVVEFFRPLVNLSFWALERAAPGNIAVHYSFNLVLHYLCTLLVFQLALRVFDDVWTAAAAAAIFAVSSVHAAAVLWISARTTLLSTFFILASLNVLLASGGASGLRTAAATALYALALASKEEAISGLFILILLVVLAPKGAGSRKIGASALVSFIVVSAAYLVIRQALMGGYFRENWGPGWHIPRNIAGGFLDQVYPWPFFSLFYRHGTYIPEPTSLLSPEIAAAPVAGLLILAGYAARKSYAMNTAVGWALLSLVPASFFRYRFFSTVSISQNRYYYLSSVGTALIIALLLSLVWKRRSRVRQGAAIAIFAVLCTGYTVRDIRLERKWDDFTRMYREVVTAIVEESGAFPDVTALAVEDPPLAFPYLADAVALERPGFTAFEVTGGRDEARLHAPCLYVSYTGEKPKLMRMERIER
jgi:hypothetical protein